MRKTIDVPVPSESDVRRYLDRWDGLENYTQQESALYKLFNITYPDNKCIEDILIKASSLNDFYSTNILSIFPVARHILESNIDDRLRSGDVTLVDDLKLVTMDTKEGRKTINFYSFFTKYCSHHERDKFPIYDSYVDKILWYFQKKDGFSSFRRPDLKTYVSYVGVIDDFRNYYDLDFGLKDTDRYLWQLGKDYFPREYRKRSASNTTYGGREEMFKGEPEIIRLQLPKWEGNGLTRYYYNRWDHYFKNGELFEYKSTYGVDPLDRNVGIKVFFDDEGYLHINNCHDPDLKMFLEKKMEGWYWWASRQHEMKHSGGFKILDVIEPYTKVLKPGFYQVRYKNLFFNFDDLYRSHLEWAGYIDVDYNNGTYDVNTEYPDFNLVLWAIMEDYEGKGDLMPRHQAVVRRI